MDNQEAKFILKAYRSNGADAGDPIFAQALEQAKNDPTLADWLRREQAFDRAVAAKMTGITVPAGLRQAILTGGKISRAPVAAWRQPSWIGLAAAIVVLLSVGLYWMRFSPSAQMGQFATFAAEDLLHGRHGGHGQPTEAAQAALGNTAIPLSAGLPVDFNTLKQTGCRTLSFAGHDVLEICFRRQSAEVHLYVMRRADYPTMERPLIGQNKGLATAMWGDPQNLYVAVSRAGTSVLKSFL
jgi:hypothetical protein